MRHAATSYGCSEFNFREQVGFAIYLLFITASVSSSHVKGQNHARHKRTTGDRAIKFLHLWRHQPMPHLLRFVLQQDVQQMRNKSDSEIWA